MPPPDPPRIDFGFSQPPCSEAGGDAGSDRGGEGVEEGHEGRADEPPSPTERPPNRWVRSGAIWEVTFAGRTTHVPDTLGARYVALLLESPSRPISALQLRDRGRNAAIPTVGEGTELFDAEALRGYHERLREIGVELERARDSNDLAERSRLEKEKQWLLEQVNKGTDLRGRPRKRGGKQEAARTGVQRAIAKLIDKLRREHALLADHLDKAIATGTDVTYSLGVETVWGVVR